MYFGRQPTSRRAHQSCFAPSRATAVLMDADNGSVDHLYEPSWALARASIMQSQMPAPIRRFATSNWQVRYGPDSGHVADMAKSTRMMETPAC